MTTGNGPSTPDDVVALATCQWSWGGLLDGRPADGYDVCLVRSVKRGRTPGPTLCGKDRFDPSAPGWSMNGGVTGPNLVNKPCASCVAVRAQEYPHLRVTSSLFGHLFAPASTPTAARS